MTYLKDTKTIKTDRTSMPSQDEKAGYKSIYNRFKQSILSGALKPSEKVPSIRVLAEDLGVAKKTVETAYDILIGEGYFISRGSKGTIVNPDLIIKKQVLQEVPDKNEDHELEKIKTLRDGNGHFRLGVPALEDFPFKKWLLLSGKAIRSMGPEDMVLPPVMGYQPLREAIANYLSISRGLNCSAGQIFITSGYKNSVALILQALSAKNDKVIFEDPGYFFGQKLLKRIVLNLHYNPVDSAGLDTEYFKNQHEDAKFVFVTPSHHSPLAVTLSLPRKNYLLDWAKKNKSWIIEDDYDGEFHYTKKVIPALKSIDTFDRVIYVGTFSKTIMPSIRTSYIVVPKELVSKFIDISEIIETCQPLLPQKILTLFLREGHFFKHMKKMRGLYSKRRAMLISALNKVYPDLFDFELSDGGMHIVAFLKKGSNDAKLASIWHSHNLLCFPLSSWYAQKSKRYGLVIGYTNIKSEKEATMALKLAQKETYSLMNLSQLTRT